MFINKINSIFSSKDTNSTSDDDYILEIVTHHRALSDIVLFIVLLLAYIIIGSWMEVKHFVIGHETGVIIIIGIFVSLAL